MLRLLLATVLSAVTALSAMAQQDTVITVLREVSVVGIKQTPESELSASTIVDANQIQRLDISAVRGVSALVPNLYMPQYGSRMTSAIYVRGLGARMDQSAVGLNVDGVSYLNKDNYDFDMFDIERVEVFRGAQSVLNGRNTLSGQINITTLSPWRFKGLRLMAEYGRANTYKAGVGYYTRLTPKVATALSVYATGTDGFFRNEYNGRLTDHEQMVSGRWKLSVHPSSRLALTNVAAAQISKQGGYPYRNIATGIISHDDTCYYWRNSVSDALTVGWTGKRVTVTSQTSLQYINDNMTLDQDFLPTPYFTLTQRRKELALTQDLYTKGRRGNVNWLGGVFGFYRNTDMHAPVTFKDAGIYHLIESHLNQINHQYPIAWDSRNFVLGSEFTNISKGIALYQQSSYSLGPWLFEFGLRWDIERASISYLSHCDASYTTYHVLPDGSREVFGRTPVKLNERGRLAHVYNQLLPKFAVGYDITPDIQLYANVAKGYKAGGFNNQMFSDVLQQKVMEMMGVTMKYDVDKIISYRPEKSWNYELGLKGCLPACNLDMAATLFYIHCTDQQLTAFPDGLTTGRIMTNAGKTRSYGAELTLSWLATEDLSVNASYGYTNARFSKYHDGKADYKGCRLPYAPQNTAFVSANYSLPLTVAGLRPSVCANVRGIGDIYWNDANTLCQPFYVTCGLSVAITADHWSLRLWGENITATKYDTFYFLSMGNEFLQRGRPVTYGATLRVEI